MSVLSMVLRSGCEVVFPTFSPRGGGSSNRTRFIRPISSSVRSVIFSRTRRRGTPTAASLAVISRVSRPLGRFTPNDLHRIHAVRAPLDSTSVPGKDSLEIRRNVPSTVIAGRHDSYAPPGCTRSRSSGTDHFEPIHPSRDPTETCSWSSSSSRVWKPLDCRGRAS